MSRQSEKLFAAMDGLDPELILGAAPLAEVSRPARRRVPKLGLIAAAAAVFALLSVAAGYLTDYLVGWGTTAVRDGDHYYTSSRYENPVRVDADGAIWFIADGQEIDITGEFDDDTPYIYRGWSETAQRPWYIAIGGEVHRGQSGELSVDYARVEFHPEGDFAGMGGSYPVLNQDTIQPGESPVYPAWVEAAREQIFAELHAEGYHVEGDDR